MDSQKLHWVGGIKQSIFLNFITTTDIKQLSRLVHHGKLHKGRTVLGFAFNAKAQSTQALPVVAIALLVMPFVYCTPWLQVDVAEFALQFHFLTYIFQIYKVLSWCACNYCASQRITTKLNTITYNVVVSEQPIADPCLWVGSTQWLLFLSHT